MAQKTQPTQLWYIWLIDMPAGNKTANSPSKSLLNLMKEKGSKSKAAEHAANARKAVIKQKKAEMKQQAKANDKSKNYVSKSCLRQWRRADDWA